MTLILGVERLIAFTTASREYPHLRPVPLQELASLKLFRAWVRRSFELKEDCHFVLVDRSVETTKNNEEDKEGLIDSDMKLLRAKDIEIVEVPQGPSLSFLTSFLLHFPSQPKPNITPNNIFRRKELITS